MDVIIMLLLLFVASTGFSDALTIDSTYKIDTHDGVRTTFDGIGAISGGGATSKLLINYPEPHRSHILDYLFKPQFGANLQILKVEIGGDSQSSDGSESSHMHTEDDENYNRGYEWWLMKEAKKRNPDILLYGLPWVFPGWIGGGVFNPFVNRTATVRYIMNWIKGAWQYHSLKIDIIGVWNERTCDPDYVKLLRATLDKEGYTNVLIVAPDAQSWNLLADFDRDHDYLDAVDVIGQHYPGTSTPDKALRYDKKLWASEEYSSYGDLGGAACWARVLSESPVNGFYTGFIAWNMISSYFFGLPYTFDSLMLANEPWSGHYEVSPPIWITETNPLGSLRVQFPNAPIGRNEVFKAAAVGAGTHGLRITHHFRSCFSDRFETVYDIDLLGLQSHHTQFYKPGWFYLHNGHGVDRLGGNGSFVSVVSPDWTKLTVVIETVDPANGPCSYSMPRYTVADQQVATFRLGGALVDSRRAEGTFSLQSFVPVRVYSLPLYLPDYFQTPAPVRIRHQRWGIAMRSERPQPQLAVHTPPSPASHSSSGITMLYVWYSFLDFNGNKTVLFEKRPPLKVVDSEFTILLNKNEVYTLTTEPVGYKGDYGATPNPASFPVPYMDTFEGYEVGEEPFNLAQQSGAFEVTDTGTSAHGKVMTQVVTQPPVDTCLPERMPHPITMTGDFSWTNVSVQVDVLLTASGASEVFIASNINVGGCWSMYANGVYLWISASTQMARLTANQTGSVLIKSVAVPSVQFGQWFTVSLDVLGNTINAGINGAAVMTAVVPKLSSPHGFVGFGPCKFGVVHFDNFLIKRADRVPAIGRCMDENGGVDCWSKRKRLDASRVLHGKHLINDHL